ncbi:YihY/virulence factor BrkB family protein [Flavobacterium sp. NG2]|uniref:YihY/virulence factor BrkB family protein n=1 Tax=Flavobacterium sp. NG2 TaxID=3097547 RepID=UPI002A835EE4|nr:YihY/virulence factor BrkB family protein [Flavobacterium sp. NG2]WPR70244.1 YihY/virulence factor BrkB family protein [Flavobacterium sp. NG2]
MMLTKSYFISLLQVIKQAFQGFLEHKVLKMSASLAYTTMFSMGPLLLVILYLSDLFLGRQAIEGTVYNQIKNFVGPSSAKQIQTIIENLTLSNDGNIAGLVGVITLLIGATSVFAEIQDSINTIWGIKPKKKSGFLLYLRARLLSFGVIGSFGFILLVSLGVSTIMDALSERFFSQFSDQLFYIIYTFNSLLTFTIISLLFGAIFKILPDAKIKWRQVRLASFTTAFLFMIGKFLISFYIANSNIQNVYGTAGSFVILMVWVYYSSVILYFGAEFAKSYAIRFSSPIVPSEFADLVQSIEIISDEQTLQKAEKKFQAIKKNQNT